MPASLSPNRASEAAAAARPERLVLLDLIRPLAFLAIVIYHSTFALWAPEGWNRVPSQNFLGQFLEGYARILAFSGFTVLILSFFLYGRNPSRKSEALPFVLLVFATVWTAAVEPFPYWWDIYPFLLCALVLIALVQKWSPPPAAVAVSASVFLSIPFWHLESVLPGPLALRTALTGVCQSRTDLGDWPLLPWAALPLLAYSLGQLSQKYRRYLDTLHRRESLMWIAALAAASPWLSKYYVTVIGEDFGCFVFRRPVYEFWAQMVPVLLLLRLSLLTRVQDFLSGWKVLTHGLPALFPNRFFFLAYFLHYPLIHLVAYGVRRSDLTFHPAALAITVSTTVLTLEILAVVIRSAVPHNKLREFAWPRISAR